MVRYLSVNSSSPCEMKTSPAISINKKCHSHQRFLASKCEWELPKLQSTKCLHPHRDCRGAWVEGIQEAAIWHSFRWTRKQDLAPDSWDAYERNEFSEPKGLHFPYIECQLPYIWSSMFRLSAPFVTNLFVAWLPLLPPWSSFLRATEMLSSRLRVLNILTK